VWDNDDQRLVLFRHEPGTGTADRLAVLRVLGAQSFPEFDHVRAG